MAVQEVIWRVRPDLIIETGVAHGGSLALSTSCLAAIGFSEQLTGETARDRLVVGIDIEIREQVRKALDRHPLRPLMRLCEGSSTDPSVVKKVSGIAEAFDAVLVILDSNHTHAHVLDELSAFAGLVSPRSYCIVMDTGIEEAPPDSFPVSRNWGPGNNPKTAVDAFLKTDKGKCFSVNREWHDRFGISCAKDGFLLRR
jgi:cephalosporin hydroxylase